MKASKIRNWVYDPEGKAFVWCFRSERSKRQRPVG